jgi:two-component system, chemotaxis family, chemotaxis protein CheY
MLRSLIVEDDNTSQLMLRKFLEPHGECCVVSNGREAVDAFRTAYENRRRFKLVCLDIMIPELDGQEVLRAIRAMEREKGILDGHGVKVIMTSALKDGDNVMTAFRELCDAYLVKPFDKTKLIEHLRTFQLIP